MSRDPRAGKWVGLRLTALLRPTYQASFAATIAQERAELTAAKPQLARRSGPREQTEAPVPARSAGREAPLPSGVLGRSHGPRNPKCARPALSHYCPRTYLASSRSGANIGFAESILWVSGVLVLLLKHKILSVGLHPIKPEPARPPSCPISSASLDCLAGRLRRPPCRPWSPFRGTVTSRKVSVRS